jgi:membrane-associated protease RseP (regulator of RpoE activity)
MSDDAPLEPITPEPAAPGVDAPSAPTETGTQTQTEVPPAASTPTAPPPTPPGTPAAEAPTQPVAGTMPPGPPPWGQPPGGSDTPGAPRSSTVAVPKWLLVAVGALVIALIGFGVGYAVAPGGGSDSSASTRVVPNPFGGNGLGPNLNPNGNGGGNGNGGRQPTIPGPGRLQGGFLGVVSTTSTSPDGARVTQVVSDSPADDAGLQADDVITKVDGDAVTSPAELAQRIQAKDAGDTVKVTYVRDGDTKTADVRLISRRDGLQQSTPSTTVPGQ